MPRLSGRLREVDVYKNRNLGSTSLFLVTNHTQTQRETNFKSRRKVEQIIINKNILDLDTSINIFVVHLCSCQSSLLGIMIMSRLILSMFIKINFSNKSILSTVERMRHLPEVFELTSTWQDPKGPESCGKCLSDPNAGQR